MNQAGMNDFKFFPDPSPGTAISNNPDHTKEMAKMKRQVMEVPLHEHDEEPRVRDFVSIHKSLSAAVRTTNWAICKRFLGSGTYGQVYLGFRYSEMDKPLSERHLCAVKQCAIRASGAPIPFSNWKVQSSIYAEVTILLCVNHVNIIKLLSHYAVEETKAIYLILEFCDGGDIRYEQEQQPGNRFAVTVARFYFKQIITGVAYLHRQQIAHLDIKPTNILLKMDPNGHGKTVKIADFGLSLINMRITADGLKYFVQSGQVRTSIPYCPPEVLAIIYPDQVRAISSAYTGFYQPRPVDVYACGVLLYSMVTGEFPYDWRKWPDGLDLVLNCKPAKNTLIDRETWTLIKNMLHPAIKSTGAAAAAQTSLSSIGGRTQSNLTTCRPKAVEVKRSSWATMTSTSISSAPCNLDEYHTAFDTPFSPLVTSSDKIKLIDVRARTQGQSGHSSNLSSGSSNLSSASSSSTAGSYLSERVTVKTVKKTIRRE
jgi:serine/threonine protein kinase